MPSTPEGRTTLPCWWGGRCGRIQAEASGLSDLMAAPDLVILRPDASAWILPQRPPHQHGNVVRPSGVEGIAQQVLADLFRRRHREEALANAIVGNVLREAVAAQQADVAPLLLHVSDDRCRLRSP